MIKTYLIFILFVLLAKPASGEVANPKSQSIITVGENSISGLATFSISELNALLGWDEDQNGTLTAYEFVSAREDLEALGEMFFSIDVHGNVKEARNVKAKFDPSNPDVAVLSFNFPIRRQFLAEGFDVVFDAYDLFEEGHQHRLLVQDSDGAILLNDEIEVQLEKVTPEPKIPLFKGGEKSLPTSLGVIAISPKPATVAKGHKAFTLIILVTAIGAASVWAFANRRGKI